MEKRTFGRTGHASSIAIFGGFAVGHTSPEETTQVMEMVKAAGINHIDVAPSYAEAEANLGPWLVDHRDDFFLGCKTMERDKNGAAKEMHKSLERLQTNHFDLYQIHAITNMEELDAATAKGSALDAIIQAKEKGLTKHIGITGHGMQSPTIFLEALRRYDFDSILFPINFVMYADPAYRESAEELITICKEKNVGTMIIKSITKGPWGDKEKTHTVWYEPMTDAEEIQQAVNFALSQEVTGICTVGDPIVLPTVIEACQNFTPINAEEQESLIGTAGNYEPFLF